MKQSFRKKVQQVNCISFKMFWTRLDQKQFILSTYKASNCLVFRCQFARKKDRFWLKICKTTQVYNNVFCLFFFLPDFIISLSCDDLILAVKKLGQQDHLSIFVLYVSCKQRPNKKNVALSNSVALSGFQAALALLTRAAS